jgi:hypothetical protein
MILSVEEIDTKLCVIFGEIMLLIL